MPAVPAHPREARSGAPATSTSTKAILVAALTVWVLAAASLPAGAAEPSDARLHDELQRLEDQQAQLSQRLQAATERADALQAELAQLQDRTSQLARDVEAAEAQADTQRADLSERVRELYKGAGANELMGLFGGGSAAEVGARSHYLSVLSQQDQAGLEGLAATMTVLGGRREQLRASRQRTDEVAAEARAAQEELNRQLAAAGTQAEGVRQEIARREEARRRAEEKARRRAEEEARRRAEEQAREAAREAARQEREQRRARMASRARGAVEAPADPEPEPPTPPPPQANPEPATVADDPEPPPEPATSSGGMACPQDHPRSFTDTWGAPRSGGRSHQGTDIFGARGGDVFAVTGGVVRQMGYGSSAGYWLMLDGDDGDSYWYMHLQDYVASDGRVSAGELIAHNGDTGNARGATPHIHFELHPGGGGPVNPYPLLKRVCG